MLHSQLTTQRTDHGACPLPAPGRANNFGHDGPGCHGSCPPGIHDRPSRLPGSMRWGAGGGSVSHDQRTGATRSDPSGYKESLRAGEGDGPGHDAGSPVPVHPFLRRPHDLCPGPEDPVASYDT